MLRVRLSDDDIVKLDYCCKHYNKNRSECVRDMVLEKYDKLTKESEVSIYE